MTTKPLEGTCHCGAVKWTYSLPLESLTACNCTLCRRYGALWAYAHLHHGIEASGPTKAYERDRKLNGFHHCVTCGCVMYYLSNHDNEQKQRRMAVNVRMITEPDRIMDLPIDHFEGLETFEDLPRDHRCVRDLWY
jgi:hypothetical protein